MGNSDLGNSILFGPVSSHHSQTLLKAFAVIMRYLDSITKYLHILLRVALKRKRLFGKKPDDGAVGASKLDARIIINEGISLAPNTSDCTDKFVGLDAQLPSEEDLLNSPCGLAGWLLRRGVYWRVLEKDIQGVPLVRFAILKGVKLEWQPLFGTRSTE